MTATRSPAPNRIVDKPSFSPPPGACDCHVHIIGPQDVYPLMPNAPVAFEDCTLEDYQAVQRALGLERAVIVMSVGHGYNYHHLLHLLFQSPKSLRGVATLAPDITDGELALLDAAGVVGARFLPKRFPDESMLEKIHRLGWSTSFLVNDSAALERWMSIVATSPNSFVLEHGGLPNPDEGVDSAYYGRIIDLVETGRCWVKLSPRFSRQSYPWADTIPFVRRLVETRPDRLLYGSDYPHPNLQGNHNEANFLDMMLDWVPEDDLRNRILTDNPAELFRFAPAV